MIVHDGSDVLSARDVRKLAWFRTFDLRAVHDYQATCEWWEAHCA